MVICLGGAGFTTKWINNLKPWVVSLAQQAQPVQETEEAEDEEEALIQPALAKTKSGSRASKKKGKGINSPSAEWIAPRD